MEGFSVFDYVIFGLILAVSSGIGIFYGFCGKKQKTSKELLIANRKMGLFPTSMSLLASFMSGITILGNPAEAYAYGTMFWWAAIAYVLVVVVTAKLFIPLFLNLDITSAYEYLEKRFNKYVRLLASCIFIIQMTVYMSLVLYAPALALNQVTGLNTWISVTSIGAVCTFYTTIGGMKAVMWTDVFQIFIMFIGLLAALIKGIIEIGGLRNLFEINQKYGRIDFLQFDLDPTVRHTVWGLTFGLFFQWLSVYGTNQSQIQRYLSVPSVKIARRALYINLIGLWTILSITMCIGLVIFAKYKDCDPIRSNQVKSAEQLFPLFVIETLKSTVGLPGLFLACLFSAALSTISTGLNSLAAVFLEDVLKQFFFKKKLVDNVEARVSKLLCVLFGVVCLILTYLVSFLGSLLQTVLALFGIIGGPILALFLLGLFVPFSNAKGAISGTLASLCVCVWLFVGFNVYGIKYPQKDFSIAGCNRTFSNVYSNSYRPYSETVFKTDPDLIKQKVGLERLYAISYTWYGLIAVLVTCVVGSIVSLITGPAKAKDVDGTYLVKIYGRLDFLPLKLRNLFHSGHSDDKLKKIQSQISIVSQSFNKVNEFQNQAFRPIKKT